MQHGEISILKRTTWIGVLIAATALGSWIFVCATPFPALAALAVLFLPRRDALVLIGASFVLNQAIGFGILHYPWTLSCFLGGASLAVASFAAGGGAMLADWLTQRWGSTVTIISAFTAAFLVFEAVLFVLSLGQDAGAFSLKTDLYILYVNGLSFAGLLTLQALATSVGFAAPRRVPPHAATAI